jgi:hypothetical protein
MTKADKQAEEIAALRKELDEVKSALAPKPKSTFVPMTDEQHRDMVHQMRERQANAWMPPSAVQAMVAAEPKGFMREVGLRDARVPTSASGMVPSTPQSSPRPSAGDGTGWTTAPPLSNPPGTGPGSLADRIADEFDRRDRIELAQRIAAQNAALKK